MYVFSACTVKPPHLTSWQVNRLTQRGRGLRTGWRESKFWDGAYVGVCIGGCSLVATVPGNKGAAYFPQIADLPELPGDTFQEP